MAPSPTKQHLMHHKRGSPRWPLFTLLSWPKDAPPPLSAWVPATPTGGASGTGSSGHPANSERLLLLRGLGTYLEDVSVMVLPSGDPWLSSGHSESRV